MTTTQATTVPAAQAPAPPMKIQKNVGSTVYTVSIHFSETGKETLEDKILKLIRQGAGEDA